MYRVWYWAMIDREHDGRFIASIPDLWDLAAYGDTDKDAIAHVTELASERVRASLDDGQRVPPMMSCRVTKRTSTSCASGGGEASRLRNDTASPGGRLVRGGTAVHE